MVNHCDSNVDFYEVIMTIKEVVKYIKEYRDTVYVLSKNTDKDHLFEITIGEYRLARLREIDFALKMLENVDANDINPSRDNG